ncbi:MAG: hypothetical protein AAF628_35485 [Planctomycetota bacterium]
MVRALLLCVLLSLQSCFTIGLWGGEVRIEPDQPGGDIETKVEFPEHSSPLGKPLPRILLTPIALAVDVLTLPIQGLIVFITLLDDDGGC